MSKTWDEAELQRHITDEIEESTNLDYKAAGALGRDKKDEITKDVSAMANADGGILIYGLKEHPEKRPVVERLDPIDRTKYSKEWLDQMVNMIRPRIDKVIIHPVSLSSGPNDVAYVVEIPKGHTAHQSTSLKYYRRHNFESVPMEDYEIRDIMNRRTKPQASVSFGFRRSMITGGDRYYILLPRIKNSGNKVINNFKLTITFPRKAAPGASTLHRQSNINISFDANGDFFIDYQSSGVLFPNEERNIGEEIQWQYQVNDAVRIELMRGQEQGIEMSLSWTLYADDMQPKQGTYAIKDLHDFG
jgi:hypothetical protein